MTDPHREPGPEPSVLLIGGPGGAGSSRATARLAGCLAESGFRVAVGDLDPWHGATTRVGTDVETLEPVLGAEELDPARGLLDRVGLDPRLAQEVIDLPGAETFEILHRVALARERRDLDVIVVDLGSRIVDVVELAHRTPWLAAHLLRAQQGWLATARPRTAGLLGRWPGANGHSAARRFAERAETWVGLARCAQAYLVGEADDPRLRRLRLGLALHELEATCQPPQSLVKGAGLARPIESPRATLTENGDGWTWRLPLAGLRSQELRVDRSGDDLALDVLGVRRLVVLPTGLRRFRTAGARVTNGHLEISFVAEESTT